MDADRAEVIWGGISTNQRIALNQSLNEWFDAKLWRKQWKELKEHEKEALLRLDWEVTLGVRFPDFR